MKTKTLTPALKLLGNYLPTSDGRLGFAPRAEVRVIGGEHNGGVRASALLKEFFDHKPASLRLAH